MHCFHYSEVFPSLLTHARRNQKHSNRSCYHRAPDHERNWKDRKYSKRNGTEAFPSSGYLLRQYWLNLRFDIHTKMKVQVFSIHQLPVQAGSIINQHTAKKKKKGSGKKKMWTPRAGFSYNIFNVCGDRLKAFFLMSHLESHYTYCVLRATSRNVHTAKAKHN